MNDSFAIDSFRNDGFKSGTFRNDRFRKMQSHKFVSTAFSCLGHDFHRVFALSTPATKRRKNGTRWAAMRLLRSLGGGRGAL